MTHNSSACRATCGYNSLISRPDSPYLRNYVVARLNPVRFHRAKKGVEEPPMTLTAALTRMAAGARGFDTAKVRERDLALVAAVAAEPDA